MIPARTDAPETDPATDAVDADAPLKRRPVRRQAKPDAVLAAAVDFAREGVLQVAPAEQVGGHVTSYPEGERLTTHRFEAFVPGYGNWHWFITLARVARSKEPTICEVGLLPSETALLAPEWLPWSERVRPEDHEDAADTAAPGEPTAEPAADPAAQDSASAEPVPETDGGSFEPGTDQAPDDTDRTADEPAAENADEPAAENADGPAAEDAAGEPELNNAAADGGSEPDGAGPSEAGPAFAEPSTLGRDD
ncbi:DUF3027 domain-containing protein [Arthrobacter frigidicola]|nr:DUF3027 domain-containing protein [Arthrobacter frigidicola]